MLKISTNNNFNFAQLTTIMLEPIVARSLYKFDIKKWLL